MAFDKEQQKKNISGALKELRRKARKDRTEEEKGFKKFQGGLAIGNSNSRAGEGERDDAGNEEYENGNPDEMGQEDQEFPENTFGNAISGGTRSAWGWYKKRKLKRKLRKLRMKLATLKVLSAKSKTDATLERGAFILMITGAVILDIIQIILLLAAAPTAGVTIAINVLVSLFVSIPLVYLPSGYIRFSNIKKIRRRLKAMKDRDAKEKFMKFLRKKLAAMTINSLIDLVVYLIELIPVVKALPLYTISKIREFGSAEILRIMWGKDTKGEITKLEKQIGKIRMQLSKIQ